ASITVTPSSTTTYTVTGTSTEGCTGTASITINVIQSPVVDYSTTQSHCGQSDGNIMTNVTGGIPPYIYQWSNGANTSNLNNISAGNYTLTVSDSNGCSSYISIILSDAPMPQANFAPKPQITTIDDPIIYFENYSIGASSYQWDFGDGYSSTDYCPSHKYDLPGVYYVVL
ncbi:MAG TPA: PKD domain-containing protein, partial [Bacteroidales bacterium]|nr:PKD domain-containing protein [Bacteroidales bacterium]